MKMENQVAIILLKSQSMHVISYKICLWILFCLAFNIVFNQKTLYSLYLFSFRLFSLIPLFLTEENYVENVILYQNVAMLSETTSVFAVHTVQIDYVNPRICLLKQFYWRISPLSSPFHSRPLEILNECFCL